MAKVAASSAPSVASQVSFASGSLSRRRTVSQISSARRRPASHARVTPAAVSSVAVGSTSSALGSIGGGDGVAAAAKGGGGGGAAGIAGTGAGSPPHPRAQATNAIEMQETEPAKRDFRDMRMKVQPMREMP